MWEQPWFVSQAEIQRKARRDFPIVLKERIAGAHQEIVRGGRGLGEGGRQPQKETGVGIAGGLDRSGTGARGIEVPVTGLAVVQPKRPVAGVAKARSEP